MALGQHWQGSAEPKFARSSVVMSFGNQRHVKAATTFGAWKGWVHWWPLGFWDGVSGGPFSTTFLELLLKGRLLS